MSDAYTEKFKSTMTIPKVIELMQNKYSCQMVERHVRALNRIATNNKNGFLLKDLVGLCKLLSVCKERLHKFPEYVDPLRKIVRLCRLPFLKTVASDENRYAPSVIETLSLLGRLMKLGNEELSCECAHAVATFYSEEPDQAHLEGLQMTRLSFNATLVERSAVAKSIVEVLRDDLSYDARLSILKTLQLLSSTAMNCSHMLAGRAAHLICNVLALPNTDREIVFVGVEILWNLLEFGSSIQVAEQLSSIECISILKGIVHDLMLDGSGLQTRQLRNDVLMICSQVVSICQNAPVIETGFMKDLCTYATFPEVLLDKDSLHSFQLSQDHEDFELKKALMCLVTTLSTIHSASSKVLSDCKVVRAFLSYAVTNDNTDMQWKAAQFEELQLLALSCLSVVAPLCVEDYMLCQGNTRALLLMDWCTKNTGSFAGFGNSFHGTGTRGTRNAQLGCCLHLLLSMCSSRDELVQQDLHEQGAIPLLVGLLKQFLQSGSEAHDNPVLLEMQTNTLLIISSLCEQDIHRKELFAGYDGVRYLVQYLKADASKFYSGLGHNKVLLAATDCTWCGVTGSSHVEDIFLEQGGVLVLLDLLKVCPMNMQNLVLGVLVDLCENSKTIPHIVSWRAPDEVSAWGLMARLWRAEEKDMGVPRERKSTLAGTFLPLMGAYQSMSGMPPIPSHHPSAAVLDVAENMRAKIYALCCKIGFHYMDKNLTTEDKITLHIIQNYLDFKSGEVWYEVAGELAQEGLRPISPDQEGLQDILHTHEGKAEETLKLQHELIDEQTKADVKEEQNFYEKMKQFRNLEEKKAKSFSRYMERTSNYKKLQEAKKMQTTAIDLSRRSSTAIGDRFHGIEQSALNVTAFCGRHVTVATTPMKTLMEDSAAVPEPQSTRTVTT